jgi:hypothetical protein
MEEVLDFFGALNVFPSKLMDGDELLFGLRGWRSDLDGFSSIGDKLKLGFGLSKFASKELANPLILGLQNELLKFLDIELKLFLLFLVADHDFSRDIFTFYKLK